MFTFDVSPLATLIEQAVLKKMSEKVGFANGAGVLATGGSNGNTLGMLCARQKYFPETLLEGSDGRKIAILTSEEAHYSVLMSANVIGIGYNNCVKVGVDKDGRMCPKELVKKVHELKQKGIKPICVISAAGSTVRGQFDPIEKNQEICDELDMWHHVDAAWGGGCLLSDKHKVLMKGVEKADSVCWDAHKTMGMPLICSAFLVQDLPLLKQVCAHGKTAHYLLHAHNEDNDLGHVSLQCGRRNDSLKLWLAWKDKGDEGWAALIDNYISIADYMEEKIHAHPRMEMMSPRKYLNVCLRYNPTPGKDSGVDLNALNAQIRQELYDTKKFMISRANIGKDVIMRPVITNPGITNQVIDDLCAEIVKIGDAISKA